MKTVRDLLAKRPREVLFVSPDTTVRDAARMMDAAQIGSVLVGSRSNLLGIFTERDLMRRVVNAERLASETTVGEVMTTAIMSCTPSATMTDCASMMSERKIRHLPVVEDNTVLGIITTGDLLADELAEHEAKIQHLESFVFYVRQ